MKHAWLLAVTACTSSVARVEQPIVGGSADAGDAAVVLLAAYPSDHSTLFTCTAEVIAPTALLTAAHCLDHAGYTFGVFFGADASAYATLDALAPQLAPIANVYMAPSYDRSPPFTADIGIAVLAAPAPVAPLPFARALPGSIVGATARIVGYGETTYGQYHASRDAATTVVAAIDATPTDTITVGDTTHATCVGDSGGPALVTIGGVAQIAGIDSYSDTTGCTQPAHFRRTDTYAPFIDQYAGTAPPSADAGPVPAPDAQAAPPPAHHAGCSTSDDAGAGALVLLALLGLAKSRRLLYQIRPRPL